MPRYAAFLRGVSPLNAKMPELQRCFDAAGFSGVRTVLGSGNVVFDARAASVTTLQARAEAAMTKHLGRSFYAIVRPTQALRTMVDADPFARFDVAPGAKRVVTFLREPPAREPALPIEHDGARILVVQGCEVFTAYLPSPRGPVFMSLIEKAFGTDLTTRTWDTVRKCAAA
jgi:uncharacterized protein (DUF1697 family)